MKMLLRLQRLFQSWHKESPVFWEPTVPNSAKGRDAGCSFEDVINFWARVAVHVAENAELVELEVEKIPSQKIVTTQRFGHVVVSQMAPDVRTWDDGSQGEAHRRQGVVTCSAHTRERIALHRVRFFAADSGWKRRAPI